MQTLTADKLDNPADNLVEFIELLAKIKVTPEKLAINSISMVGADGIVITY
jgi:hypothetical protein